MKYFFWFFFLFSSFSIGQEIKKDSITKLNEVVVFDKPKQKQVLGIVPSTVIGTEIFQNFSPVDIVSSINQVSGVYVLSGALNTNRITIRGVGARTFFGTDKLRMYYNNIPITNGTGTSEIEAYDLENLNSFEVVKGPKSIIYGSNLGGAILLKPKEELQKNTTLSNSFTAGSYGLIKNSSRFLHTDENVVLNFSYGYIKTDGFRENSNFHRDGFLLNSTVNINSKNKLSLLVSHVDLRAEIPSSLSKSNFDENPKQAAFTWNAAKGYEANDYTLAGLSLEHEYTQNLKNTTSIFYSYLDHYEPRPFNILDEFTNGYGFRTHFEGAFSLGEKNIKYTFGGELYKDEYNWQTYENRYQENGGNGSLQGDKLSDNKEYRSHFQGFASVFFPFSDVFSAQLGFNLNKTKYSYRDLFNVGEANKNAKRNFDFIALPSFTVSYDPSNNFMLYGNISWGFSNPNLEETLTPDGAINPAITQETGINYELGTTLYTDNKNLKIDLAVYQMNIKNLLVAERTENDVFIGKNAGSSTHKGVELNVNYVYHLTKQIQLVHFLGYTYNHHKFKDFMDNGEDFSGNWLTGVPRHRINSSFGLRAKNGLSWNLNHQYVGKIPLTDANTLYSDAFSVFNFKLGYGNRLTSNISYDLNFGVSNILNTKYAQSVLINASSFGGNAPRYYYPANNRNFYGGLRLRYQL